MDKLSLIETIEGFFLNKGKTPMPVLQGAMGVLVSSDELVAAMVREGYAGTLAGAGLTPEQLRKEIVATRAATKKCTKGLFGVNLMVPQGQFAQLLDVCIEEKVGFVALGAGFSPDAIKKLIKAEIPVFVIVSSLQAARLAFSVAFNTAKKNLAPGAFGIIIEAPDLAGGHLGISVKSAEEIQECLKISIWELLLEIVPFMRNKGFLGPIVAAGGILHGSDIKRAFDLGANAVQMATRFLMTPESNASQAVKNLLLETEHTKVGFSPVKLPIRTVFSQTEETLPKPQDIGKCPECLPKCPHDTYCIFLSLLYTTMDGIPLKECLICAGGRIGEIHDILPVSKIISNLWKEFQAVK